MDITEKKFHRLFSLSMYKTLKLSLGRLSFFKDFINSDSGDLYPVISKSENAEECIKDNEYILKSGSVERVMGQFFPYATYELNFRETSGKIGFSFNIKGSKAQVLYENNEIIFDDGCAKESFSINSKLSTLIISCRPGSFDVYSSRNNNAYFIKSFNCDAFNDSNIYEEFKEGFVSFVAQGDVVITDGSFYIDSGVSQADLRPITYEDGTAIYENGSIFLTASIRMQEETFQGVLSWIPGTAEFDLVGAIFYDSGDGRWCGDVAASVVFNRMSDEWNLWVCSFAHSHILGYSSFSGDPRFGINVIDINLMKKREEKEDSEAFLGKEGDEDPAFIYDKTNNRWLMAICRLDDVTRKYRYMFYESQNPFNGHKFIGKGFEGEETGGSFVNIDGEICFICGNSFSAKSDYRIYNKNGMKNAKFDFPDGGFRGWGTVIPIMKGSRRRYYWITFDRHNGSLYNWSYGNIYCFEMTL